METLIAGALAPADWLWTAAAVLLVCALVGVNALFVAAEFAIVRVRRTRLEELAGQEVKAARVAILSVERLSESLTATQVGVTVASLGIGWIGEASFARLLEAALPAGALSPGARHGIAAGVAFALITLLLVVLGELVPKNLAVERAEQVALRIARPLWIFGLVLRPLVWLFTRIAEGLLYVIGHRHVEEPPLSEEELKLVLKGSHEGGVLTEGEARIVYRAFEFADRRASEIMVPAERVHFLSLALTIEENLLVATSTEHTRLPLCRGGLDEVVGIVNMKDAWPLLRLGGGNEALGRACRPPVWLRPETSQDRALHALQAGRAHMGLVRDGDRGPVLGVVTLEDVLESLLGDVREGRLTSPPTPGRPPPGGAR